jgi:TRAP transporter 4TM/12TM fusion protein
MSQHEISAPITLLDRYKQRLIQIAGVIAFVMSVFHFAVSAGGALPTMQQRSIHLGFVLVLIYTQRATKKESNWLVAIAMSAVAAASVIETAYVLKNWEDMALYVATPSHWDTVMGAFLLLAVLVATYMKLGPVMPGIAAAFVLYALVGPYLPSAIAHRGFSFTRIVSQCFMSTGGIYSSVLGVSATYIFLFVLFGALLEYSGAANFFIDLATALFGKTRGGSAKVTTVASCLFGMVSGSGVANIMAIGPLTLPIMRKEGYSNMFGGAILSVAGTGGQFMPPIMGAAAFIIAETLGIPYIHVALGAFIPGLLYYAAIWFCIDVRSAKENIKTRPAEEIPDWRVVIKNGFYLSFPFLLLVFFLAVVRWSPIRSGFWSIIAVVAVSWVKKETRMGPKQLFTAFVKGAYGVLDVAIVCALAGVIVGMLSMTGLGLKFSGVLVSLSQGNMAVLLVLTAVSGVILGMGMNTTSVYIILAVLVAPALVNMGVEPLSAHLFVFYFGILSSITPPVALSSYAAASLSKEPPMELGFMAWKIGLSGYILPFMFIYNKELLFIGSGFAILKAFVTSLIGIFGLSCSLEGYFRSKLHLVQRVALFAGALLLIDSGFITDIAGLGLTAGALIPSYLAGKRTRAASA